MVPQPPATAAGPAPGSRGAYYAARIRQLVRLDLTEDEARALWHAAAEHRQALRAQLGRDVGLRVALLDYVVNIHHRLAEPQIIERSDLEAIEQQAITDPLTTLYNRRYFEASLAREAEHCLRYGRSAALLLLDLDRFKQVNDRLGHAAGDAVLRTVGSLILKYVRAADVPSRVGGDEFAVVLPDTSGADALVVGERIRRDIHATLAPDQAVTVSGGIARMTRDAFGAADWREAADRALYRAKAGGGNRVVVAGQEFPTPPVTA